MIRIRHGLGGALAIALTIAPMPVEAAAPQRASERVEIVRASLSIDTTALGGAAEGVKERIRVRGEALLRSHDVLPGRGATDPIIAITVEPLGSEPGYRCAFAVRRGDAPIAGTEGSSLCQLCTEDELVDHLEAAIERTVPRVPASATNAATDPSPSRGRAPPPPAAHTPELRALGKAGIAVAIASGITLGVGIGLVAREQPSAAKHPDGPWIGGVVITTASLGLLAAGLAMFIVDMRRGRADRAASTRAQRQGRPRAWRVSPTAGRAGAGMLLRGRF